MSESPENTAASPENIAPAPEPQVAVAPAPEQAPQATARPVPAEPGGRRTSTATLVAAITVAALVGGVSGAGVSYWAISSQSATQSASTAPGTVTVNDAANATTITAVAQSAAASVVTITATVNGTGGSGSGVVLNDDGYILSNAHVVTLEGETEGATITVQSNDGRLYDAVLVGTDPLSDLAVIKVDGATDLKPATFADSSALNVGDLAIAIGAPLGLAGTVTNGIVSALNRSITIASSEVPDEATSADGTPTPDSTESPFDFWEFNEPGQQEDPTPVASSATISLAVIQTDAAINPGNSGGALLDAAGAVIGINVAIATAGDSTTTSGSIGVGFAIPANLAKRVAAEIIEAGAATHGLLGASIRDVSTDDTQADVRTVGASVVEVTAGGAADKAGIHAGDIITGINGLPITGATDLTAQVRSLAAGADATITFTRGGNSRTVDVVLGTL